MLHPLIMQLLPSEVRVTPWENMFFSLSQLFFCVFLNELLETLGNANIWIIRVHIQSIKNIYSALQIHFQASVCALQCL